LQREALPITAPGCRRDWVFVDDVVSAIVASLDGRADGEVVNLASGRDSSNEEVVGLVADAVGRPLQTLPGAFPARPWDVRAQRVSTEKAKQKLGWSADVALEQGIARTVASLGERSVDREAVLR
jgi:nucleoside-diphosphate-sugar epimerase